jgi:recombination protein RecA
LATNASRAKEKALKLQQENDPDYVAPKKEKDTGKLVEAAIKSIAKDGCTFSRMKDKSKELRPVLPTGIFGVDHAIIGSGGFPRGRIVELFGVESGGKGTLLSQLIANTQRLNPSDEIAYVDAEAAFDHSYAAKLGVDTDNLLIAEPEYGEQALQAALDMITTGGIKLVCIDSVAALIPRAELEGEVSDQHMGLQAAMMGRAIRKMTKITSKTGTCVCFVNQLRATMNTGFGAKSDTPGGKALKFFASLRLSVDRIQAYKERGEVVGSVTKVRAKKNKTFKPFEEMDLNLMFDTRGQQPGFDSHMSLVDLALANGIWVQDGSKYNLVSTGESVTGKANLRDALRDNKEIRKITEEATLVAMGKSAPYIKRALRG